MNHYIILCALTLIFVTRLDCCKFIICLSFSVFYFLFYYIFYFNLFYRDVAFGELEDMPRVDNLAFDVFYVSFFSFDYSIQF